MSKLIIYLVWFKCYNIIMNINKALLPVAAIGLAFATPSCSEAFSEEKAVPAVVSGFDYTVDVELQEKQWQDVSGNEQPPQPSEGRLRNISSRQVQDGCKEVGDSWYYDEQDASECWLDWCNTETGDDTHCVPKYKTFWDYQQRVWSTIGHCVVKPINHEIPYEKPRADDNCLRVLAAIPPNDQRQTIKIEHRYLRVTRQTADGPLHNFVRVDDPDDWRQKQRGDCVLITDSKSTQLAAGNC